MQTFTAAPLTALAVRWSGGRGLAVIVSDFACRLQRAKAPMSADSTRIGAVQLRNYATKES
jgi:hypothetical protein